MNIQGDCQMPELRRGKTYYGTVTLYTTLPVYNVDGDPTSGIKTPGVLYTGLLTGSKTVRGKMRVTDDALGTNYAGQDIGTVTWSVVSASLAQIGFRVETTVTDPSNTDFPVDTQWLRWDTEEVDTSTTPATVDPLIGGVITVKREVTYT